MAITGLDIGLVLFLQLMGFHCGRLSRWRANSVCATSAFGKRAIRELLKIWSFHLLALKKYLLVSLFHGHQLQNILGAWLFGLSFFFLTWLGCVYIMNTLSLHMVRPMLRTILSSEKGNNNSRHTRINQKDLTYTKLSNHGVIVALYVMDRHFDYFHNEIHKLIIFLPTA